MKLLKLLLASLTLTSAAQAALNVNVTGTIGSGQTTWQFSGSYATNATSATENGFSAVGSQFRSVNLNAFEHSSGDLSGELTSAIFSDSVLAAVSGGAIVTGSTTGAHAIDGVYIDNDGSSGADDFAWFANGTFNVIETLTFSGSIVVAQDISAFGDGAINSTGDSLALGSTSEITPLSMTFTAVPEPSTYGLLLGLAGLGLVFSRRR